MKTVELFGIALPYVRNWKRIAWGMLRMKDTKYTVYVVVSRHKTNHISYENIHE